VELFVARLAFGGAVALGDRSFNFDIERQSRDTRGGLRKWPCLARRGKTTSTQITLKKFYDSRKRRQDVEFPDICGRHAFRLLQCASAKIQLSSKCKMLVHNW
jgi:hypothetical protein